jgi:hypothetical protein
VVVPKKAVAAVAMPDLRAGQRLDKLGITELDLYL